MTWANGITILIFMLSGSIALAQESMISFKELEKEISVGENVRVVHINGNIFKGKVEDISPDALTLKGGKVNLPANSIQEIQKKHKDPWWNGFLIGGGIGIVSGIIVAQTQCRNDSECSAIAGAIFVPSGMAIGMATGALIDRAVTRYDTVYTNHRVSSERRFQISPIISREQKRISLSFAF
jgi:hypothetical protein